MRCFSRMPERCQFVGLHFGMCVLGTRAIEWLCLYHRLAHRASILRQVGFSRRLDRSLDQTLFLESPRLCTYRCTCEFGRTCASVRAHTLVSPLSQYGSRSESLLVLLQAVAAPPRRLLRARGRTAPPSSDDPPRDVARVRAHVSDRRRSSWLCVRFALPRRVRAPRSDKFA